MSPAIVGERAFLPADLLLVMTPWRYHARDLFPEYQRVHAPLLDVIQQYYPWRKFYRDSILRGELPLWNPYMFSGTPFVANGQSAIFYPFNALFLTMPVARAFGWIVLLHLVIAGWGMYGFLVQWRLPAWCAFIGGVAFMLCGFLMAWLNYITLLCTGVWLPMALLAFERSIAKVTDDGIALPRIPHVLLSALPLAFSILAGHFQIAFYIWFAFAIYVLIRYGQAITAIRSACELRAMKFKFITITVQFGKATGATLLFAFALAAPQLLPSVELSRMSTRADAFDYTAILANRLPPEQLIRLIVPNFFGNYPDGTHWNPFPKFNFIERTGYMSIIALLLAGAGCMVRHPLRPFGMLIAMLGLLLAMGSRLHIVLAYVVPGVRQLVGASRALFLFNFGIALLAAIGAYNIVSTSQCGQERNAHHNRHHPRTSLVTWLIAHQSVVGCIIA
ncbi:MAG TPA: hypothetical protein EYP10_15590, partial [Armatimonadetes bacterium]|nr:hypothetical protein [Armatimonadota bacterium]